MNIKIQKKIFQYKLQWTDYFQIHTPGVTPVSRHGTTKYISQYTMLYWHVQPCTIEEYKAVHASMIWTEVFTWLYHVWKQGLSILKKYEYH